uniref:Uncharacterized protein n=1 Tax=Oryza meridionalis TaxID=40149 RepID=A0A0E0C0A7_9ORYZ
MVDIRGTNVKASTAGDSGIACSEGEDVGAGDGAGAGCFEGGLDLVDHLETPEGVQATLQVLCQPSTISFVKTTIKSTGSSDGSSMVGEKMCSTMVHFVVQPRC